MTTNVATFPERDTVRDHARPLVMHVTPAWHIIAMEQVRAVGLAIRPLVVTLFIIWALFDVLMIALAVQADSYTERRLPHSQVTLHYTPEASAIVAILALLMGLFVWMDEEPNHRAYHWMMPVGRVKHALLKTFAGFAWLVPIVAIYVVNTVCMGLLVARIQGIPPMPGVSLLGQEDVVPWHFIVPFGAALVCYAFGSAAAIGSSKPVIWIFGIPVLYASTTALFASLTFDRVTGLLMPISTGRYGFLATLGDGARGFSVSGHHDGEPLVNWLLSLLLWITIAAIFLAYTALVKPHRA